MPETFNIYCDESRHLEHDGQPIMLLGAVWCPLVASRPVAERIREVKAYHGLPETFEIKWSKVSDGQLKFYLDVVDYFFDTGDLHFRAIVIPKGALDHEAFQQDHDTFYFKMYFTLLRFLLDPRARYRIYLDIKDTRSAAKVRGLSQILANSVYDFQRRIVERVQTVRSHEIEQMQIVDLLLGAVGYATIGLTTSPAKLAIVERIRERSSYSLTRSTLPAESKLNIFHWVPNWGAQ